MRTVLMERRPLEIDQNAMQEGRLSRHLAQEAAILVEGSGRHQKEST
jgi:hypothetical protein